jgi:two-component system NtrC family response regulator
MENCIRRAVIMTDGAQISVEDLGLPIPTTPIEPINLRKIRENAERNALIKTMARVDGNIAKAAELLGVSRPTIYDLLNRHGIR